MDPHKEGGLLAAYIVGIGVGECVVFCAVRGVCCLRERIWRRGKGVRVGVGVVGGVVVGAGVEEIDEWEEIERPGSGTSSVGDV